MFPNQNSNRQDPEEPVIKDITYQDLRKFDEYNADFSVSDEEDHNILPKSVPSKTHAVVLNDYIINNSPLNHPEKN